MILVLIDLLPVLSASPQKAGSLQCTVTRPRKGDDDYDRHDDDYD